MKHDRAFFEAVHELSHELLISAVHEVLSKRDFQSASAFFEHVKATPEAFPSLFSRDDQKTKASLPSGSSGERSMQEMSLSQVLMKPFVEGKSNHFDATPLSPTLQTYALDLLELAKALPEPSRRVEFLVRELVTQTSLAGLLAPLVQAVKSTGPLADNQINLMVSRSINRQDLDQARQILEQQSHQQMEAGIRQLSVSAVTKALYELVQGPRQEQAIEFLEFLEAKTDVQAFAETRAHLIDSILGNELANRTNLAEGVRQLRGLADTPEHVAAVQRHIEKIDDDQSANPLARSLMEHIVGMNVVELLPLIDTVCHWNANVNNCNLQMALKRPFELEPDDAGAWRLQTTLEFLADRGHHLDGTGRGEHLMLHTASSPSHRTEKLLVLLGMGLDPDQTAPGGKIPRLTLISMDERLEWDNVVRSFKARQAATELAQKLATKVSPA